MKILNKHINYSILQCKVGSQVKVRVGGDFLYDPKLTDQAHNLLLIAGGKKLNEVFQLLIQRLHI